MEKEARPALGADLVIPGLALALAVYFLISTADLVWEAKANGVVIGAVLVILIVLQVGRVILRGGTVSFAPLWSPRELAWKRIGLVIITALFIATLPWLGLTLGLWLGMAAQLWIIGVRRWQILLCLPAGTAASVYLLFIVVLDSAFPHGPIEMLLGR